MIKNNNQKIDSFFQFYETNEQKTYPAAYWNILKTRTKRLSNKKKSTCSLSSTKDEMRIRIMRILQYIRCQEHRWRMCLFEIQTVQNSNCSAFWTFEAWGLCVSTASTTQDYFPNRRKSLVYMCAHFQIELYQCYILKLTLVKWIWKIWLM